MHENIVKNIKLVIQQYSCLKNELYDKTYKSLKPLLREGNEWKGLSPKLKNFIDNNVTSLKNNYISEDRSCSYMCRGESEKYKEVYVLLKYYPDKTFNLKRLQLTRTNELLQAVNPQYHSCLLLDSSILPSIDEQFKQAALLKTLHVGNLQELLEDTELKIPIVMLKYYFRMLARMLEYMHFAGFCHWGIYSNKVKLNKMMFPVFRNIKKIHNVNNYLPGGLKCSYQLPPLYTADKVEGQLTPANKKAIDLYMLGVLIYRALLGVPHPYERQDSIKGTQQYNFDQLIISFSKERLEVMGWTLEEIEGSKSLLEGLLQIDPAKQLKAKDVVAHKWLKRDPTLH